MPISIVVLNVIAIICVAIIIVRQVRLLILVWLRVVCSSRIRRPIQRHTWSGRHAWTARVGRLSGVY